MFKGIGTRTTVLALLIVAIALPASADKRHSNDLAFLDGLTLIELSTDDISSMHAARELVESFGGTIAIMSPPSLLIGWIPDGQHQALLAEAGIRSIHQEAVSPASLVLPDERQQTIVGFYNRAVNGVLSQRHQEFESLAPTSAVREPMSGDVFDAPALERDAYIDNLERAGLDVSQLELNGTLLGAPSAVLGNSDAMSGTVAMTIFFIESDGSGTDPDLYTWTAEDMQHYVDGVATGMAFWSNKAFGNGCSVTWLINYRSGADPVCQQWTEPILHDSGWQGTWISAIMNNMGYTSGGYFTKVTSFNTWQRAYYETDRSYSAFVPYNPPPAPSQFSDGATAYAYLGGPFTVLLYNVQGWITSQVFTHETGHIFGACDEYTRGCSSCTQTCGFVTPTVNANCEACNPSSRECMMKANSFVLCQYTPGQLGWDAVPCNPPPPASMPAPTITSISPPVGQQGLASQYTITGTNLFPGVKVEIGGEVFVDIYDLQNDQTLVIDARVLNDAPLGLYGVKVKNRDGKNATLTNGFEVLPTTRHYYSPTGGNNFPYITPADAANDLTTAIQASYHGDTLYVPTGSFDNVTVTLDRGVLLHGAWDPSFASRDLATGKTVLNLDVNVTITPGSNAAGLDGFILTGGFGSADVYPFVARFGGAIQALDVDFTVANCEIHTNAASTGGNYGVGGAIFAYNSTVDIRDNYIHDNDATQGGGLYLFQCTGLIAGNTIANNTLSFGPEPAWGIGIMLSECTGITMADNTLSWNATGLMGSSGGGVYLENSTGVVIDGGMFDHNGTHSAGGALTGTASTVTINATTFADNSVTSLSGGAINSGPGSNMTITECEFFSNAALIGGAIYAPGGSMTVNHNLFVGNSGTATGGAVIANSLTGGSIIGNTFDGNVSAGVGAVSVSSAAIEVFNNIISNSTGSGLSLGGSPLPTNSYNLLWSNSSGDYVGVPPGPGAVSSDPLFANGVAGDYHLSVNSPAIDAGNPDPAFNDPDGSRGDIGYYGSHAFAMAQPSYPKHLQAGFSGGDVILSWDKNPEGDIDVYAVYCDTTSGFVPGAGNFIGAVAGTDSTTNVGAPQDSAFYVVSAIDTDGYGGGYSDEATYSTPTGIDDTTARLDNRLDQNVPNPFNPVTSITYELAARSQVSLDIYDVEGRLVRSLVHSSKDAGPHTTQWNGMNDRGNPVASGIYFYRLTAGSFVQTKKMVLLK